MVVSKTYRVKSFVKKLCISSWQPRIQDLAKGGGGGGGTLTMNECEARGRYEKRGGGGGGVLSVLGPIRKAGGGGDCLPYDDLYLGLCTHA